jgi:hypothetical protein
MKSIFIFGSSVASVGIPEDIQKAGIQVLTALAAWALTAIAEKIRKRWNKPKH